jgi:hypothetical protein
MHESRGNKIEFWILDFAKSFDAAGIKAFEDGFIPRINSGATLRERYANRPV